MYVRTYIHTYVHVQLYWVGTNRFNSSKTHSYVYPDVGIGEVLVQVRWTGHIQTTSEGNDGEQSGGDVPVGGQGGNGESNNEEGGVGEVCSESDVGAVH